MEHKSCGTEAQTGRSRSESLLCNVLTPAHFSVINQALVHSPSLCPHICYCKSWHITGPRQCHPRFIDSSSEFGSGLQSLFLFFINTFSWIYNSHPTLMRQSVFSQLINGQINQRPYFQSICWEDAVLQTFWTKTGSGGTVHRHHRHHTSQLIMFCSYRCQSLLSSATSLMSCWSLMKRKLKLHISRTAEALNVDRDYSEL